MAKPCKRCATTNTADSKFCRHCGAPFDDAAAPPVAATPAAASAPASPAPPRGIGVLPWAAGLLAAAVLVGAIAWVVGQPRAASEPPVPATRDEAMPADRPTPAAMPAAPAAAEPVDMAAAGGPGRSSLWEPIDAAALPKDRAERDARVRGASAPEARGPVASRPAAAGPEAAGRRADDDRAFNPPATAPAPPVPAMSGTAQALCANRNPISLAICEARECSRAEHAAEPACQRIRAAEERRRQPN